MAVLWNDSGSESAIDSKEAKVMDVGLMDLRNSREVAHGGSYHDTTDIRQLGKKQELRRNFRFFSILGFAVTLVSTWEGMIAFVFPTSSWLSWQGTLIRSTEVALMD